MVVVRSCAKFGLVLESEILSLKFRFGSSRAALTRELQAEAHVIRVQKPVPSVHNLHLL